MRFLLKLVSATLAVLVASYILPGVSVDNITTAIIVAIVLGVMNTFVKPILVILTLPITVLTLGIFYLVINALMVIITASFVKGFSVDSTWSALIFGLLVSLVESFLYSLTEQ